VGLTVSLPRSAAVTDELLDSAPPLGADELAVLRRKVLSGLALLAAELPAGRRLVLDGFRLRAALSRPETMGLADEAFAPSPWRCRRAVGLAAIDRCLRAKAPAPAPAVDEVLAGGLHDATRLESGEPARAPWWARWYAGLPPAGRVVVAAEATTWATQLWTALDWGRLPRPVVVGGHDDWWDLPCRRITLHGRAEVRVRVDGRSVLVLVGAGAPQVSSRSELVFAALVAALVGGTRSAPGRVVGLWPAAGQVRVVPVGVRTLDGAADEVLSAVATWVDVIIERQGVVAPGGGHG